MTKPLYMWAGGKNKLLAHYKPYMPAEVDSYCEPFFGGGAMYIHVMNTYKPKYARINDINKDLMGIYEAIKNDYNVFIKRMNILEAQYLPLEKVDRKKWFYDLRTPYATCDHNWSPIEESATLYFLMKTGFNGIWQTTIRAKGRYDTPFGLGNQKDKVYDRDILEWWHNALQKTDIQSTDWNNAANNMSDDTFFFFDPPYRESVADYGNGFSDEQLLDLIAFSDTKQSVMLSNRDDCDWFSNQKHGMDFTHINVTYTAGRRLKTANGHAAKKAREILLYRTTPEENSLQTLLNIV